MYAMYICIHYIYKAFMGMDECLPALTENTFLVMAWCFIKYLLHEHKSFLKIMFHKSSS